MQANKNHVQDLQTAHDEYSTNLMEQAARLQRADEKAKEFETRNDASNHRANKAAAALVEMEIGRQAVQSELDDLLMVFGDLEDKASKYKKRLQALGESVSDGEDEAEDGAGGEEDEDDVD